MGQEDASSVQETLADSSVQKLRGDDNGELSAQLRATAKKYPVLVPDVIEFAAGLLTQSTRGHACHAYSPEEAVEYAIQPYNDVPDDVTSVAVAFLEYLVDRCEQSSSDNEINGEQLTLFDT